MRLLGRLALIALAAASFLPLLGGRFWLLDLAVNFRPQMALAAAVLLLLALALRFWGQASLFAAIAAVGLYLTIDFPRAPQVAAGEGDLRIVSFNLQASSRSIAAEIDWLLRSDADIVAFYEVSPAFAAQLARLEARYPHSLVEPRAGNFGIALFSRLPLKEKQLLHPADASIPAIRALLERPGGDVEILALHPPPPMSPDFAAYRDLYFDRVAALKPLAHRRAVMGDLNAAPWSEALRDLARSRGFAFASERWPIPTWPVGFSWPFTLPIDHLLLAGDLALVHVERGPTLGSDHWPVVARIALPAK